MSNKKPHKHAELIKAWAEGAEIEFFENVCHAWLDCTNNNPAWDEFTAYRIKLEPKPDVTAYFTTGNINREMTSLGACVGVVSTTKTFANLCLTYDGETGKLKSAEVL